MGLIFVPYNKQILPAAFAVHPKYLDVISCKSGVLLVCEAHLCTDAHFVHRCAARV